MWYGLTKDHVLGGFVVFFVIAALLAAFLLIRTPSILFDLNRILILLSIFVMIPGIWLVFVSILTITWLKVDKDKVEWYLWKKIHLMTCPIADITQIGAGSFSALVIKTKKGTIHLIGLDVSDGVMLSHHLKELNPKIEIR